MTRREFLTRTAASGVAFATGCAAVRPEPTCDLVRLQAEIDDVPAEDYLRYLRDEGDAASLMARYPALARVDAAMDAVLDGIRRTEVGERPAVWYVYNMGVVVKTRESLFSIDLCHRRAEELAPLLDFAVITHNHDDHFTRRFYERMDGALHKTVITNFADNYGAAFNRATCGFARGERVFKLKDVTVRTMESDHNRFLRGFTMPVEVTVGGYSILHVGDTVNSQDLKPSRTPDLWVHHAYCWDLVSGPGAAALKPKLSVVAHLQELSHPKGRARWTFEDGRKAVAAVEAEGCRATLPLWGDRIF